jgi:inward rectifier potassium channel
MPIWQFILLIFAGFILINILFACIYFTIGVDHLGGIAKGSPLKNFVETFFFSTQTFTTVGYGRISPIGMLASAMSAFEAFVGLLSFAIATGLFYGRFSRPQAFLRFSDNAIIGPYKKITALMFRTVPYKNNNLTDAEVKLTLAMRVKEDDKYINRFYPLELELSKINALVMNWTIVHPITENSPLHGMSMQEMQQNKVELLVYIKAFDDAFSNTVIARTSYTAAEIIYGAKFKFMYHPSADGSATVMRIEQVSDIEKAELPELSGGLDLDKIPPINIIEKKEI